MRVMMVGVGAIALGAVAAAAYVGSIGNGAKPPSKAGAGLAAPASNPAVPVTTKAEPARPDAARPATPKHEVARADPATSQAPPGEPARAEEKAAGPPPSFDVVLLKKSGSVIAGWAAPGSTVTVEDNGAVLGQAVADKRGEWVMTPGATLSPGQHLLDLSSVAEGAGAPVKAERRVAVELPDEAAKPSIGSSLPPAVAKAPFEAPITQAWLRMTQRPSSVTVRPGSSLWWIARDVYGAGPRYTEIWTSNRDQIPNPDLIYPGQVLTVPQP
jgi:nucleoid-associated protein YgaU